MFLDILFRIRESLVAKVAAGVLVVALLGGVGFVVLGGGPGSASATGPTIKAPKGVSVIHDDRGQIVVTNRDELNFKLSFALPQNCEQTKKLMLDRIKDFHLERKAPPEERQNMLVLHRLGEELCSYRDFLDFNQANLIQWYGAPPPTTVPSSTPPAGQGAALDAPGLNTHVQTEVGVPTGNPSPPASR